MMSSRTRDPATVGAVSEFPHRQKKCFAIDFGLAGTEILGRPPQYIREIEFCGGTETNAPFTPGLGHH
jgi:hypothetical protein